MASLLLLICINAYFLLHWGYNVCQYLNYKNNYFAGFLKIYRIMLCKNIPKSKLPDSNFQKEETPMKKLVKPKKAKLTRKKKLRKNNKNKKVTPRSQDAKDGVENIPDSATFMQGGAYEFFQKRNISCIVRKKAKGRNRPINSDDYSEILDAPPSASKNLRSQY